MARVRSLPVAIQCPSVGAASTQLEHEDCSGSECPWWEGGCTARTQTEADYLIHETTLAQECPLATRCRWHIEAMREGHVGCVVRRLGMLCEHQGGEWNTFQMADPDEWEQTTDYVEEQTDE